MISKRNKLYQKKVAALKKARAAKAKKRKANGHDTAQARAFLLSLLQESAMLRDVARENNTLRAKLAAVLKAVES